jgi:hypothetical protein
MTKLSRQFDQVMTRTYRNVSRKRSFELKGAALAHIEELRLPQCPFNLNAR